MSKAQAILKSHHWCFLLQTWNSPSRRKSPRPWTATSANTPLTSRRDPKIWGKDSCILAIPTVPLSGPPLSSGSKIGTTPISKNIGLNFGPTCWLILRPSFSVLQRRRTRSCSSLPLIIDLFMAVQGLAEKEFSIIWGPGRKMAYGNFILISTSSRKKSLASIILNLLSLSPPWILLGKYGLRKNCNRWQVWSKSTIHWFLQMKFIAILWKALRRTSPLSFNFKKFMIYYFMEIRAGRLSTVLELLWHTHFRRKKSITRFCTIIMN